MGPVTVAVGPVTAAGFAVLVEGLNGQVAVEVEEVEVRDKRRDPGEPW